MSARSAEYLNVVISSGADVIRGGYAPDRTFPQGGWVERLPVTSARLGTARNVPLLTDHVPSVANQVGSVEEIRRVGDVLAAKVRFGVSERAQGYADDVRAGTLKNVSLGYQVTQWSRQGSDDKKRPIYQADQFTILEVSLVAVPSDERASFTNGSNGGARAMTIRAVTEGSANDGAPDSGIMNRSIGAPVATVAAPAVVAATGDDELRAAREAETVRVRSILGLAARLGASVPTAAVDALIADGTDVEAARTRLLDAMAQQSASRQPHTRGQIDTRPGDVGQSTRDAVTTALAARLSPLVQVTPQAEPFTHMSVLDMDRELARMSGQRPTMQRSGLHTTSDFSLIFQDAARVALASEYATQRPALLPVARKLTASDKQALSVVRLSATPQLLELNQHAEIVNGTVGEESETIAAKTFARMLGFSRDLILADQLGMFAEYLRTAARSASNKLGDLLYTALTGNAVMADGTVAYHANHGNLAAVGTDITADALDAAIVAMRTQKFEGRPAGIVPAVLVVGPLREAQARRAVAAVQAVETSAVNPYAGLLTVVVEDRIPDKSWYVTGAAGQNAPVAYVELDGTRPTSTRGGPAIDVREGWRVLGLEARVIYDANAGLIDWRATYRNPGVA